jgi:hypothetical protein
MQWRQLNRRPKRITAISIVMLIAGVGLIGTGITNIHPVHEYSADASPSVRSPLAAIVGVFEIFVGYGLYSGKGWAWTSTVIVQFVVFGSILILLIPVAQHSPDPAGTIGQIIGTYGIGAIAAIIVLPNMFRSTTRAYFGKVRLNP